MVYNFYDLRSVAYVSCIRIPQLYMNSVTLHPADKVLPYFDSGTPSTTTLVYNESTRSLTCTSTGGPATTVTWRKDGAIIAIGAAYQQTQVVTDSTIGTYETVLTIAQSVTDVSGTYSCSVENIRGTSGAIEATGTIVLCNSIHILYK